MMRFACWMVLLTCGLYSSFCHAGSFVVSTHPIYLIAKAVTQGVETPQLLLGNQSGHDVQLSPQQRKMIKDAELVVWLGKQHEAPLYKLLQNHPNRVALLDSQIVTALPLRNSRGQAIANSIDSHVWLEPNNAIRIAYFIAVLRSQQNPNARAQYFKNARQFSQALLAAAKQFDNSGNPQPYWAYHDAYQYLERALNLKLVGALTEDPHVPPSAAQLKYLNDNRPRNRMCLLAEASANRKQFVHLQPLTFQAVNESLNADQDFIQAWQKLASTVNQCVQSSVQAQ